MKSKTEKLIFPDGVRLALREEIPLCDDATWSKIQNAKITTGYYVKESGQESFEYYIEANIHANKSFAVFSDLVNAILPDSSIPLLARKDESPSSGPYIETVKALEILEKYTYPLEHNGFLEYGLICHDEECIEEVYVDTTKYFRIWTSKLSAVINVFLQNGIPEAEGLEFIDEYPRTTISLEKERSEEELITNIAKSLNIEFSENE